MSGPISRKVWKTMYPVKGFLAPMLTPNGGNIHQRPEEVRYPKFDKNGKPHPRAGEVKMQQCGGFIGKTGTIPREILDKIDADNAREQAREDARAAARERERKAAEGRAANEARKKAQAAAEKAAEPGRAERRARQDQVRAESATKR